MLRTNARAAILALLLVATVGSSGQTVAAPPLHSPNLTHVTNIPYDIREDYEAPGMRGSDLEFAVINGRRYAVAGSYLNGMRVIDITEPAQPVVTSIMDCAIFQGDVQILIRDGRTYVIYAVDDYLENIVTSPCFVDAGYTGEVAAGFFVVDISDPANPDAVSFTAFGPGSHNTTLHPGGRYLYSSNADLGGAIPGTLEIFDLANLSSPSLVRQVQLLTGLHSHDVTFNADGTRAYSAALTHTLVLDTTQPDHPKIVGRILDPTINIHHQADPITIDDPLLGTRTFLIVSDEIAGAAELGICPGGGLHVFDITGPLERVPVKVGVFEAPELVRPTLKGRLRCTAHVFRMYPEQGLMTMGWYSAGVRVIDISNLIGISAGVRPDLAVATGMREIAHAFFPDSDTWAAKVDRFEADGSFYLFGSDTVRGFDVYRDEAGAPHHASTGSWHPARSFAPRGTTAAARPYCLIRPGSATAA